MIAVDVVVVDVVVVVIDAVVVFMTSVIKIFVDFCLCSSKKQLLLEVFSFFSCLLSLNFFAFFSIYTETFRPNVFTESRLRNFRRSRIFGTTLFGFLKVVFDAKKIGVRCQNEDICKTKKRLEGLIFK